MKNLILILNGKGGVGKSFFAVNFVQYLKDKGFAHVAIDSDNENSTLKRFHPDTWFLDMSKRRALDGIFAALEKANLVVMDCRAASTDLFIEFFAEIDLFAVLSALGAKLTLVMPVNHESDNRLSAKRLSVLSIPATIRCVSIRLPGFLSKWIECMNPKPKRPKKVRQEKECRVRLRVICLKPPNPDERGASFGLHDNSTTNEWLFTVG